jgi:hypothetical protein
MEPSVSRGPARGRAGRRVAAARHARALRQPAFQVACAGVARPPTAPLITRASMAPALSLVAATHSPAMDPAAPADAVLSANRVATLVEVWARSAARAGRHAYRARQSQAATQTGPADAGGRRTAFRVRPAHRKTPVPARSVARAARPRRPAISHAAHRRASVVMGSVRLSAVRTARALTARRATALRTAPALERAGKHASCSPLPSMSHAAATTMATAAQPCVGASLPATRRPTSAQCPTVDSVACSLRFATTDFARSMTYPRTDHKSNASWYHLSNKSTQAGDDDASHYIATLIGAEEMRVRSSPPHRKTRNDTIPLTFCATMSAVPSALTSPTANTGGGYPTACSVSTTSVPSPVPLETRTCTLPFTS